MNWLNKFERKHPRFGIPNLMIYIVVSMLFIYVFDSAAAASGRSLSPLLVFYWPSIMSGQFWRIITFILLPPNTSPIFIIFSLYFSYMIGSALENQWGTCTFTVYYLIGVLGSILAGMITGAAYNIYLNLSLFFAFAILFPDFQIMLFFILPVKIKYLAYLNIMYFVVSLILGSWADRAAIIASLLNLIIFFSGTFIKTIKRSGKYRKTRANFRRQSQINNRDRFQ